MTSAKNAKCLNFGPTLTHPPLPLYPQTSNFTLSTRHSWTSSIGIQNSPKGNFEMLLENFNNEINIVAQSFFFANTQSVYYSDIYNKIDRKANRFSPRRLCTRFSKPQVLHASIVKNTYFVENLRTAASEKTANELSI